MRNAISAFSIPKGVNLNLKSLKLRATEASPPSRLTTICPKGLAPRRANALCLELRAVILCKTLHDDQRPN